MGSGLLIRRKLIVRDGIDRGVGQHPGIQRAVWMGTHEGILCMPREGVRMHDGPRDEGGERLLGHRQSAASAAILVGQDGDGEIDGRPVVPLRHIVIVDFRARHKEKR